MRLLRRVFPILLLLGAVMFAEEKPKGLEPMDVFNLQFATDAQISPRGDKIVYVRQFSDIMSDKRCANLWIINPDGTDNRPLTTGVQNDTSPRWSPDGTRLAFISDRDGRPQIFIRWMDTGQIARITSLLYPPSNLVWAPDGTQLAFTSFVSAEPLQIAKLPKAPKDAKWAESPIAYDKLIYRFNGAEYLKPGFHHLFVVSAEGGTPRQLSSGNFQHGGVGFGGSPPVWTPDSKFVLISANRKDDYEYEPLDSEIYEFSVESGTVRALTHRRGPDNSPAVSPDGKWVAYTGFDDRYQGHQTMRLYLMNRDGSGSRLLSEKLDRDAQSPRWAPDSSGVYFLYDEQGDTKIGFYALEGKFRQLGEHVGSGGAYGGGANISVAKDGTFATTFTLPDRPGSIAVGSPRQSGLKVITNLNRDLLAQRRLGQVEEIWYTSSQDGRKIQGWIIKPPDFAPAKKYPLIIEIHGGPFANYGDRFDLEKQIYAAAGYVVLYTNPRGSTSYGEEFANLIHHAYPGDDFYDLNSGVDAVVAKGYVDPNNLFVTGGSGGGVLTCWMIGNTTRFRAAASLYPVINWYSFTLTADIPSFVAKYWFPGFPWEYPDAYMKRSVISVVNKVKTPTLVMTGENDFRTPISEAEQYYEALKLLKVDSVLVRVPDEPHGLARHPSHHVAKVSYVLGWFDKHRTDYKKPATEVAAEAAGEAKE